MASGKNDTKWRPLPEGKEWRSIDGADNFYVAEDGTVVGPTRKPLTPWLQKRGGYPAVKIKLYPSGKWGTKCVHVLVAETFIGPKPEPHYEVCHKDGDPTHCHVSNLYWGTRTHNVQDMYKHGTYAKVRPTNRGSLHSAAKLTEEDVLAIRREYIKGSGNSVELAERYNITQTYVCNIAARRIWTHV